MFDRGLKSLKKEKKPARRTKDVCLEAMRRGVLLRIPHNSGLNRQSCLQSGLLAETLRKQTKVHINKVAAAAEGQ